LILIRWNTGHATSNHYRNSDRKASRLNQGQESTAGSMFAAVATDYAGYMGIDPRG